MSDTDSTMSGEDPEATVLRRPTAASLAAMAVHHVLLLAEGSGLRRIPLTASPLRIGRVPGHELVLAAPEVSRSHCTVTLANGRAVLTDPGSTNGTFVEGERAEGPVPLVDGAHIHIGPFLLVYRTGTAEQLQRAEALEQELRRACAYIQAVLPAPIGDGPVRAAWHFLPSTSLGGDGFGYQRLPDGRFTAWLIDVNGHGVGSALLAVSVMNVLRQTSLPGADIGDPGAVLATLNTMFQMDQHGGLCLTAWYGVFDPARRTLRHATAGQHPAFLRPGGGAPEPLSTRNLMLGAAPDILYRSAEAAVPPGSRLYLFSDGAFEITAADGTQRGLPEFLPLLAAPPEAGVPEPERLFRAIRAAARPGPFDDDVSLVVLDLD